MNLSLPDSRTIGMILLICGLGMVLIEGYSGRPFVGTGGVIMLLGALSVFTKIRLRHLEQKIQELENKLGVS